MDLMEVIRSRRSIRKFTDKGVSDAMVKAILEAAMLAPSAGNQQPWRFIVVRDREKLNRVPDFHPYAKMIKQVEVAIVVCGAPDGCKWPDFWIQDCSAAIQNLLLAARGMGLGTVWTGVHPLQEREDSARELFGIPENVYPLAIIPLGWPDGEFTVKDRFRQEFVFNEVWEG